MSYSVKKAGVQFYVTVDTGSDLTGKAANFSLTVRNNSNGDTGTGITIGSFAELAQSAGTYQVPVTITGVGDYTAIIENTTDNLGSITAPLVVTNAVIDDVYNAVDTVESTLSTIAADVANLDGASLAAIQTSITDVQNSVYTVRDLINNKRATITFSLADVTSLVQAGDLVTGSVSGAIGTVESSTFSTDSTIELVGVIGTFQLGEELNGGTGGNTSHGIDNVVNTNTAVDSVLEFVAQIDAALADGTSGLAVLESFTDDIELMLTGSEFLQDGSTPNPFYDATNPGVASSAEVQAALVQLQSDIASASPDLSAVTNLIGANTDTTAGTLFGNLYLAKQVVDANKAHLENAGYGLSALETLLSGVTTTLGSSSDIAGGSSIYSKIADANAVLSDGTHGLAAIKTKLDTMDGKLDTISTNVDSILAGSTGARIFV